MSRYSDAGMRGIDDSGSLAVWQHICRLKFACCRRGILRLQYGILQALYNVQDLKIAAHLCRKMPFFCFHQEELSIANTIDNTLCRSRVNLCSHFMAAAKFLCET